MRIGLLVPALVALCPLSLIWRRTGVAADARIPTVRAEDVGMSAEEIIGIMMTQVRPCTALNIRRDFQTLAYQAIVGSTRTARASN